MFIFEEFTNTFTDSDCQLEDYHVSLTSNEYTSATELIRSGFQVIPIDKTLIKKYEFYIMAQIKGRSDSSLWIVGNLKTLIVGCTDSTDIAITEKINPADLEPV